MMSALNSDFMKLFIEASLIKPLTVWDVMAVKIDVVNIKESMKTIRLLANGINLYCLDI